MDDSRTGSEKEHGEPGVCCEMLKKMIFAKGQRNNPERDLTHQIQEYLTKIRALLLAINNSGNIFSVACGY